MIYGNTEGVRNSVIDKLENIYKLRIPKEIVASENIINTISEISINIKREICVAIDRRGNVVAISIGDSSNVEMPVFDVNEKRLSGVKVVHTHPNGNSRLSAIDLSALLKLRLDCIVAIGVEEKGITDISLGFCNVKDNNLVYEKLGPFSIKEILQYNVLDKIKEVEVLIKNTDLTQEEEKETAIIVGTDTRESLEELRELAKACNVEVVCDVYQRRSKEDPAFFIGKGKAEELSLLAQTYNVSTIIFDDELAGSQVRNLEDITGVKVIDRTILILDIFATRAKSREAKIQVELAQLKYRLPRLTGLGVVLSRTGAGIGTRGPGEKKLEIDKRHIRERVYDLTNELKKIKLTRQVQREKRNKQELPKVSLVGYTNAGKSTLRNKFCEIAVKKDMLNKEKVFEADMLFATLDTTTRVIVLTDNRMAALTDTVGFIRKLPHDLVEAFKSTLEEVIYSDILIHVVDASAKDIYLQIDAVEEVLKELEVKDKPIILALNKVDKVEPNILQEIENKYNGMNVIKISAKENINLDVLLNEITKLLPNKLRKVEYLIPYSEQNMYSYIFRNGKIEKEEYKDNGTYVCAQVDEETYNRCKEYMI